MKFINFKPVINLVLFMDLTCAMARWQSIQIRLSFSLFLSGWNIMPYEKYVTELNNTELNLVNLIV